MQEVQHATHSHTGELEELQSEGSIEEYHKITKESIDQNNQCHQVSRRKEG